ncbi:MAG: serine/threonine protein kinase, partial [Gammaproteobacteria bacterium]|nr:serine/threonine protein kinase [Gammaproteobacteria bacterium]
MSDGKPEDNKEALEKNDDLTRVHQGRESGKGDVNEEKLRSQPAPQKKPVSPDDKTNIAISPSPPSSDFYSESVEPESSDDFTILQPHEKANSLIAEDRTELSYQPEEDEDQKTILMGPGEPDDNTYVPGDADQDATILSNNETMATFVASSKADLKSGGKGNSEAGRLLKNRFVLEERIGSGGMGDVYKALDLRAQEARERNPYIAIKILNENFARHRDAFISLQREYSKTRGIPHENIMAVYDFDREGDTVFMSMELLDGEPLDDFLKKHKDGLDEEDARQIIKDYCQGLIRAHGAGIVHSDFKPGNIYYTTGKTAKVFDFGIARAVSTPGELSSEGDHTVFDAGTLGALTPTYASYEMLTGQSPSKSDDVFAAALVAYEIFTGRHPYNRIPADKAYQQGLEPDPIPFLKKRHWRALKKALGLRAQERTESLEEFYEGLFSEDPPVLRYSFAALGLVLLIGYGVYQAQDSELDAQIASRQSLLNENKERIEIRLKNVTLEDFRGRA